MTNAAPETASPPPPRSSGGKHLAFTLAGESYAADVRKVREIIRMTSITPVPRMPAFVRGVINLRGRIIPVIDLRVRFDLPNPSLDDHTCIIVVQIQAEGAPRRETGLIVDSVDEVLNLETQEIEATPDFGTNVDTRYLLGVARTKGQVRLLLDLDRILAPTEFETLRAAASSVAATPEPV